jgi:hypothetical protein
MQEEQAFCPPCGYVCGRQGVQVTPLDVGTTVGYQVRLQKAGSGIALLLERADRDLLFEQDSSSRRREAALAPCALGTQETISCGCAHGEQLAVALLTQVEMLMPLQRFDHRWEKRHEAFRTNPVGCVPDQEQGVLDFWSVTAWPGVLWCGLPHLRMVEEIHGILSIVPGRFCQGIQQFTLLLDSLCLAVLRNHAASVMLVCFAGSIRFPRLPPLALSCVTCSSEMTEDPLGASPGIGSPPLLVNRLASFEEVA